MKKTKITSNVEVTESKSDKLFLIVRSEDGYRIAVANSIVSAKVFKTIQAAEDYINSKPYELLINTTIFIMTLNNQKQNEKEETIKKAE